MDGPDIELWSGVIPAATHDEEPGVSLPAVHEPMTAVQLSQEIQEAAETRGKPRGRVQCVVTT